MALKDILTYLASNGGVTLTDPQQLEYTIAQVNHGAKELYEQNDMVGSLREEVYHIDPASGNLVSLEPYVGIVRAVRYFYPQYNLKVRSMAPRYVAKFWQLKDFLSWEMKGDRALKRDISNTGVLTFNFRQPVTSQLCVTIIGKSPYASQIVETLVCPVGTTVISSVNQFDEVSALAKDQTNECDCDVTDIDGNIVATLSNNQKKALYQIVQVINLPNNIGGNQNSFKPMSKHVECLWKLRWKPMVNPQDEFICPRYDEAIFWKYMENKALLDTTQSMFSANQAQKYQDKCNKILKDVAQDTSQSMEMSMNFGENPTLEAFAYIRDNRVGYGQEYGYDGMYSGLVYP